MVCEPFVLPNGISVVICFCQASGKELRQLVPGLELLERAEYFKTFVKCQFFFKIIRPWSEHRTIQLQLVATHANQIGMSKNCFLCSRVMIYPDDT